MTNEKSNLTSVCFNNTVYPVWQFVLKLNQSPNNLRGNSYGLHCPQPNSRGSCPLINLACPSAKHWISLQDCCIIQHSHGWERMSVVWSHLSLGRAAKQKRWRRMRWWNESNGRQIEGGGRGQEEVGETYDEMGKEMRLEIKKRGEIKWLMWFNAKGTVKDHIFMKNRRVVRGLYTGSPSLAVSSLLLLTSLT